jgi:hypothetical protein
MRLAVGRADVASDHNFYLSMAYWQNGSADSEVSVHTYQELTSELELHSPAIVEVSGDCQADVFLQEQSCLHIYGNLGASVHTRSHCQVVVGGDISRGAVINGIGINALFVGGDVLGSLRYSGMCMGWVTGDLLGDVLSGYPSLRLHVEGDCFASIRPFEEAAMLALDVGRFMPFELLEKTAAFHYTEFRASVGMSDKQPGIHPERAMLQQLREARSHNRWVIHEQKK